MLTPDLLRRIRQIELHARKLVAGTFAGAYHSVYKGRGIAFTSVRPYVPGDDVRFIDWKVTARSGVPHVKQYVEERELTLMMAVDGSASLFFGSVDRQKQELAAELAAVLAYCASFNNDQSGLLMFTDHIEHHVTPSKGRSHVMRLIRDLLTFSPTGQGTDLALAIRTLSRTLRGNAIIFLISDFMQPGSTYARDLSALSQQHQVSTLVISDPLEERLPPVGLLTLNDAETGRQQLVDTTSPRWQEEFRRQRQIHETELANTLKRAGVPRLDLTPDADYVQLLKSFFEQQAIAKRL